MNNEQVWENVFKFIEKDNNEVKNKDGRIGILTFSNNEIIIKYDNDEKKYLSSETISNIINDGWILE